jgi:ABC-type uncharacterized transport system involved in gliding motility auxiliary subunit
MAHHGSLELLNVFWFAGWCIALLVLFVVGLRLPLQPRWSRYASAAYTAGVVVVMALVVLANAALIGHDAYFDLTRERVFTPSRQALEVIDSLAQDVQLTYFYQAHDAHGKRLKELVEVLGRRNPHLHVRTVDPDKQPSLAVTHGVRLYNTAVLEAASRRSDANPRTTYLPAESAALVAYLAQGGAVLLMYDLGFVIEPRLVQLLHHLGVWLTQTVVIDPQQHYATDPEMVAVGGLEPHAITKNVSLTFFPGIRALELISTSASVTTIPLIFSSKASYTRPVDPVATRLLSHDPPQIRPPHDSPMTATVAPSTPRPHPLAVAAEGIWPGALPGARSFRAVVIGDADFASNSLFPYVANSDLVLSMIHWLATMRFT